MSIHKLVNLCVSEHGTFPSEVINDNRLSSGYFLLFACIHDLILVYSRKNTICKASLLINFGYISILKNDK